VFFFITIFSFFLSCDNDESPEQLTTCNFVNFKYYNNEADFLGEISKEYIVIASDTINNTNTITSFIQSKAYFDTNYDYVITQDIGYKYKYMALKLDTEKNCFEITNILTDLKQSSIIAYAHYAIQTDDCTNMIWEEIGKECINSYSAEFYVKVFDENDLTNLNNTLQETNTILLHQYSFSPKLFVLRADKNSNGDALQMANYFHETNFFEYSEPNIIKIPVAF